MDTDKIAGENQILTAQVNFYLIRLAWKRSKGKKIAELYNLFGGFEAQYSKIVTGNGEYSIRYYDNLPQVIRDKAGEWNALSALKIADEIVQGKKLLGIGKSYDLTYWSNFFGREDDGAKIYGSVENENNTLEKIHKRFADIEESTKTSFVEMQSILQEIRNYKGQPPPDDFKTIYALLQGIDPQLKEKFNTKKLSMKFWECYIERLIEHYHDVRSYMRIYLKEHPSKLL